MHRAYQLLIKALLPLSHIFDLACKVSDHTFKRIRLIISLARHLLIHLLKNLGENGVCRLQILYLEVSLVLLLLLGLLLEQVLHEVIVEPLLVRYLLLVVLAHFK